MVHVQLHPPQLSNDPVILSTVAAVSFLIEISSDMTELAANYPQYFW